MSSHEAIHRRFGAGICPRNRVCTPERRDRFIVDGEFSCASGRLYADMLEGVTYGPHCIGPAVAHRHARCDVCIESMKDVPSENALTFPGADGAIHDWILLDTPSEPVVWATTQYRRAPYQASPDLE